MENLIQYNAIKNRYEPVSKELLNSIRNNRTRFIINAKVEDLDYRLKNIEKESTVPLIAGSFACIIGIAGIGLCATADGSGQFNAGQFITGGLMGVIGGISAQFCIKEFRYQFSEEYKSELDKIKKSYDFWSEKQKNYSSKI